MLKFRIPAVLTAIILLMGVAWAQTSPPTRVRGVIASVGEHAITVNARDGARLDITLNEPLTVMAVKRVDLASITPNTYVGIASRTAADGKPEAIEVLVFPEAMRGTGEGHYAWDLEPGSMMTNAPVTAVVQSTNGRDLTLTHKGGTVTIHVPPDAPVVTLAQAERADMKPGAPVFLSATKNAEGQLSTGRVTVGKEGVAPPM